MRIRKFSFTDENFGEQIECVTIWEKNLFFLIAQFENRIVIKEYKEIDELLKEFLVNENELLFLREQLKDDYEDIKN